MRITPLRLLAIALIVTLGGHLSAPATAHAGRVLFVDADATGIGDGSSWSDAFARVQDALAGAVAGDEVWVAEGTYLTDDTPLGWQAIELVEGVGLYGGFAGNETAREQRDPAVHTTTLSHTPGIAFSSETILRGQNLTRATVFDGFRVRINTAYHRALDLLDAGPVLDQLDFVYVLTLYAHADWVLRFVRSDALLRDVSISNSYVMGAVLLADESRLELERVTIRENYGNVSYPLLAQNGSSVRLVDCLFQHNSPDDATGGITARESEVVALRTRFERGRGVAFATWEGSAVSLRNSRGTFVDCEFTRNTLEPRWSHFPPEFGWGGSAIGVDGGDLLVVNSTFVANSGYDSATIVGRHCTIVVVNSLFWANPQTYEDPITGERGPSPEFLLGTGANVMLSHNLVEASGGSGPNWDPRIGLDLGGNLDADPYLVDAYSFIPDASLQLVSPAIDAGVDASALLPPGLDRSVDLAGNPRVSGPGIDLGAYEFQRPDTAVGRVAIGTSWDETSLQQILDDAYGPGVIDAATDYSGFAVDDPVQAYWFDDQVDAWFVRQIAGNTNPNVFGWYVEDFAAPMIDGIDDGVLFDGAALPGAVASMQLDAPRRLGFYLDPNGDGDATNAPQPERFFANRVHNDAGPDGSGAAHQPEGGDVQCLIYDITALRGGVPTYVLAWEDFDAGSPLSDVPAEGYTDDDYNDLVVEIRAASPVAAVTPSLTAVRAGASVRLTWSVSGLESCDRVVFERRTADAAYREVGRIETADAPRGEWSDESVTASGRYEYRFVAEAGGARFVSEPVALDVVVATARRSHLVGASPNPFNPRTTIEFVLRREGSPTLRVYDLAGRLVRNLDPGRLVAGTHRVEWDGRDDGGRTVSSGVYLVRLFAEDGEDAARLVVMK